MILTWHTTPALWNFRSWQSLLCRWWMNWPNKMCTPTWITLRLRNMTTDEKKSMVSCQRGPTRHASAWQIGPFWQDTLEIRPCRKTATQLLYSESHLSHKSVCNLGEWKIWRRQITMVISLILIIIMILYTEDIYFLQKIDDGVWHLEKSFDHQSNFNGSAGSIHLNVIFSFAVLSIFHKTRPRFAVPQFVLIASICFFS